MKTLRYETFKDRVLSAGYRTAVMHLTESEHSADESLASLIARHEELSRAYQGDKTFNPAEEFARESASISGLGPLHAGKREEIITREVQGDDGEMRLDETRRMVYVDPLFEKHVDLAQTCLTWRALDRIAHPVAINMPLCGDLVSAKWRSGVRAGMWDRLPNSDTVKDLIDGIWLPFVENVIAEFKPADEVTKTVVAWGLHDFYICIEPFDKANGRSARLLLQITRIRLGLGAIVVRHNNMRIHDMRFKTFRDRIFVPLMKEHGYLL